MLRCRSRFPDPHDADFIAEFSSSKDMENDAGNLRGGSDSVVLPLSFLTLFLVLTGLRSI